MPVLQNGISRKVRISADRDDFLTFHTREKSRLAYTDVRLLAVLAWRVISCVCDGTAHSHFGNLLQADTGRACDGAGLAYADMVRRKG